jgi:hypothetical protein
MGNDAEFNPYASPEITTAPRKSAGRARRVVPYESGHARAMVALVLAGVCAAVHLLSLVSHAQQYALLQRIERGIPPVAMEERLANDERMQNASLALIGTALASMLTFYIWLHRAYRNLYALGVQKLEQSPGWAIGYYFIPILSLFKPHQGMKEIVRGSDPEGISLYNGMGLRGGVLVGVWWAAFLIDIFTAQMLGVTEPKDGAPAAEYMANTGFAMMQLCISIVSLALTAYLIWRVDRWQTERNELLENFVGDPQAGAPLGSAQPDWSAFNFDK